MALARRLAAWPAYPYSVSARISLWISVAVVGVLFGYGAWERRWIADDGLIVLRTVTGGEHIGVRQVSGMIARTIVCPLKPGDRLERGHKFGMIKFGSTTELILPRPNDVTVHVKKGDRVRAGVMVLATLRPPV